MYSIPLMVLTKENKVDVHYDLRIDTVFKS